MKGKGGLGRGIDSLLSQEAIYEAGSPGYFLCPIERIRPNPHQPRKNIGQEALASLARSIKERGVLQPLVVREAEGAYEIIAGERRWRAAQIAGLRNVPVVIKDVSPGEVLELALIENIQREDLNPIEEARAFRRLVDEHGLSQGQVAARVGRDRSTVANFLRLLNLPADIQQDLLDGRLTVGHARALLMAGPDRMKTLRDRIVEAGLSVRQAEALAGRMSQGGVTPSKRVDDPEVRRIFENLVRSTGLRVRVFQGRRGGKVELSYRNRDELERIVRILGG